MTGALQSRLAKGQLEQARVLLIGAGGLGCAAARVLVESGVGSLAILDDDTVDVSNLQRQTLYTDGDVGAPKATTAAKHLAELAAQSGRGCEVVAREIRLDPACALELVAGYDLVLEGSDNFATKFLVADACALTRVPVVQAGAVRWLGWALASVPRRSACLRCVFEGLPPGPQNGCAEAGVVGPVVGAVGALQAALAVRLLAGDQRAAGELWSYAALPGVLRRHVVQLQAHCALCSGQITDTELSRYAPPECAA
jgi:molybdopterin/thiamine biosynthesis adenylyltransferase